MSWERDPLYAKARLFLQRGRGESRDDPVFGLWCSLGLELLARAAVASVSPALLAEPDRDHKYLLHALGRGSERIPRKSIAAAQVLSLCLQLFAEFTDENYKLALALVNRRNEELHTGSAAFAAYPTNQWIVGFYRCCQALSAAIGETLVSLLGEDEANVAAGLLAEDRNGTTQRVQNRVASYRAVFQGKDTNERVLAQKEAETLAASLAYAGHHRVACPACESIGMVTGRTFGKEHVADEDGNIVVRQPVAPSSFSCPACGLRLDGYAELETVELGGYYTRRTTYSPEEYYGLIHPDDLPEHLEAYLADKMQEYDNE